jgi:hypothetical protein
MRTAAISLIVVAVVGVCYADESTIQYAGVQEAQRLSGVIRDQAGAPIPQIAVEEVSDDWSKVLQETTTDADGHWALPALGGRRIHNIRFLKGGFHQVRFRVRLTRRATKPLDFEISDS